MNRAFWSGVGVAVAAALSALHRVSGDLTALSDLLSFLYMLMVLAGLGTFLAPVLAILIVPIIRQIKAGRPVKLDLAQAGRQARSILLFFGLTIFAILLLILVIAFVIGFIKAAGWATKRFGFLDPDSMVRYVRLTPPELRGLPS